VLDGHPAYGPLLADAATTGRCPVWITEYGLASMRPPDDSEQVLAGVARLDAAEVLARKWPGSCYLWCDCRVPFGDRFPGLVAAPGQGNDPVEAAVRQANGPGCAHLALVRASRPTDAPAAPGWSGPCNYGYDLGELSAVLRSWEDRFGAPLVEMDAATLWLSVAAPPLSEQECLGVAAEHFAFCCDVDGEDPRPLRVYAATLRGTRRWRFWWD